jgi:hypothetical protein
MKNLFKKIINWLFGKPTIHSSRGGSGTGGEDRPRDNQNHK